MRWKGRKDQRHLKLLKTGDSIASEDVIKLAQSYHKYNARPTECDGIMFPSKAQAERHADLKFLESVGTIEDVEVEPVFWIKVTYERLDNPSEGPKIVKKEKIVPDWRYKFKGQIMIEEKKGYATRDYKRKAKLFKELFPELNYIVT